MEGSGDAWSPVRCVECVDGRCTSREGSSRCVATAAEGATERSCSHCYDCSYRCTVARAVVAAILTSRAHSRAGPRAGGLESSAATGRHRRERTWRGWILARSPTRIRSPRVGPRRRSACVRVRTLSVRWARMQLTALSSRRRWADSYSSRCSIPFFETFASVISFGIQSGLLSGAVSSQAHPS